MKEKRDSPELGMGDIGSSDDLDGFGELTRESDGVS